jgi:hypothetical protein
MGLACRETRPARLWGARHFHSSGNKSGQEWSILSDPEQSQPVTTIIERAKKIPYDENPGGQIKKIGS